jgi:hypothetical protein
MSYKVTIREKPDHIRVKVKGQWNPENELDDSLSVWIQVADFCRKRQKKGVIYILSVWDVPGHLSTVSAFEIGNAALEISRGLKFKLAVVQLHEERLKDSLFAEKVAVNRGIRAKVFDNEREAKKWLLGQ